MGYSIRPGRFRSFQVASHLGTSFILIEDPITLWIDELRDADHTAAAKIWNHFVSRLHGSAKQMLNARSRRVYDEEDAALSAFQSICAGFAAGRFPDLQDRESLWRLLLVVTSRKVSHRHRHDRQQRRDNRRTLTESVFAKNPDESAAFDLQQLPAREPTPEFAATFAETCDSFFESLDDQKLRDVAALRMEGYSDSEIAQRLSCSRSTVQRRLELIRRHWQGLADYAAWPGSVD